MNAEKLLNYYFPKLEIFLKYNLVKNYNNTEYYEIIQKSNEN